MKMQQARTEEVQQARTVEMQQARPETVWQATAPCVDREEEAEGRSLKLTSRENFCHG